MGRKIIDFSKYLSIKIGPILEVEVIDDFDFDQKVQVIGFGYNLLVSRDAKHLAILSSRFDYIKDSGDFIEVGATTSSSRVFHFFKRHDLAGLEFLVALPGSIGGLIKMNAGMKGYEIGSVVDSAYIDCEWRCVESLGLGYRESSISGIVFAVRFKKQKGYRWDVEKNCRRMRKSHPREPSFGSCFKNPQGDFAGRMIESVGLRGYRIGGVGFSNLHANFLVNYDSKLATFEQVQYLIDLAKDRVFDEFGVRLEEEVRIIR